ncbi:MAG: ATP-binding protein [Archangium sp.]|nr:ATP-binding protein [Archangium sp.]
MSTEAEPVRAAQEVIMRDVLGWALPTSAALSLITLITSLVSGMFPQLWSRGVPSLVLLGFSVAGLVLLRRNRLLPAVSALIAGLSTVIFIALTFNGGVRSPSAMFLFFLVALCGWAFGRRGATVMAAVSVVVITTYFVLGLAGVLTEPPLVPLVGEYVMLLVLTALIWGTSAFPPSQLRKALLSGQLRERELRQEQAARLEAAHRFQAVFDQTPHLMGLITPEGIVVSVNRAALEFASLRPEQVLGKPFGQSSLWPEAARASVLEALTRARDGVVRFETSYLDSKQRPRNIELSFSPFRDEAGQLRFIIAEARDVTELMQARERKSTTQRLELVGQLAGGVAHDFNNVLMAILASTEALRLDLASPSHDPAEVQESLDIILESGRRAGELTRRLLTFGRRGSLERRTVSMHGVLDSSAKLLARTLPPNIRVVMEPRAENDRVMGDFASLESALINLALNARDAMPEGGTLTFSAENVVLDATWCEASGFELVPGPFVRISVRDTGTGITPEHAAHVFEPFFTTKEEGKGTGLGLASVFGVVREHGGAVHLYSELGRGTVFHLTLPSSAALVELAPSPEILRRFEGQRVLVIDDEAPVRRMLMRLLGRLGLQCTLAASAEEGLARSEEGFDLLITDIVLPGRRGNELAAELLGRQPSLRALLISGFPKDSELSSLPADRVRLLAKPFTFEALQREVGQLLG